MCSGIIVQFDIHGNQAATFACQSGAEFVQCMIGDTGGRGDDAICRFAELCLQSPHDRHNPIRSAERTQQKLPAARLCQCQQRARVDGAEMVEVLPACRKLKQLRRIIRGLTI